MKKTERYDIVKITSSLRVISKEEWICIFSGFSNGKSNVTYYKSEMFQSFKLKCKSIIVITCTTIACASLCVNMSQVLELHGRCILHSMLVILLFFFFLHFCFFLLFLFIFPVPRGKREERETEERAHAREREKERDLSKKIKTEPVRRLTEQESEYENEKRDKRANGIRVNTQMRERVALALTRFACCAYFLRVRRVETMNFFFIHNNKFKERFI